EEHAAARSADAPRAAGAAADRRGQEDPRGRVTARHQREDRRVAPYAHHEEAGNPRDRGARPLCDPTGSLGAVMRPAPQALPWASFREPRTAIRGIARLR